MPKAQFGTNGLPANQFGMPTSLSNGAVQYNGMQLNTNNPGDIGLLKQALDSKGQFNTSMTTSKSGMPDFTTPNYNRVNLLRSLAPKAPSLSFKPLSASGQAASINPFSQSSNALPAAAQPMGTAQPAATTPAPQPARKWHSEWDDQGFDTDPAGANYQPPQSADAPKEAGSKFGEFMQKYNTKIGQPMEKAFQGMDQLISWGNLGTQLVNGYKKKQEFDKYMRRQTSTDSLFPEVTSEMSGNRGDYVVSGSRTGEFRPDEYVVNKGMYTGQFQPRMAQYGGGVIPDALTMPLDEVSLSSLNQPSMAPTTEASSENNVVNDDIKLTLSNDFKSYADTASSYINSLNPNTDVTGEMLASGAQKAYQKYGKIVPVELALAQLQTEGYLANTSKPNKPQRTKNPFNVGNTDTGKVVNHNSLQAGVDAYYNLLATDYLTKKTPEQLLNNFTNFAGERYASSKKYENSLKAIVSKIKSKRFEHGGVYELTEDEIKHILASGGEVEFL
jgi:hypothetical protein